MGLLFIVGVGRSGTSLLQSMLAAHPSIKYMPETGFIRKYMVHGTLSAVFAKYGESAVVRRLTEDHAFKRLGLDEKVLVHQALKSEESLEKAIYTQMVKTQHDAGITWVGDKDPRLIEFLPFLEGLGYKVAVINIVRDPRDVLLSKKKAAWSSQGHVWKHIFSSRVQLRLGRTRGPRLFGKSYVEVLYEDLIVNPQKVLSEVCDQINIRFSETMLAFDVAAKQLVSADEISWKKETLGPLLPRNKDKWRDELSNKEILLTEFCCKEAFSIGGYKRYRRKSAFCLLNWAWVAFGLTVIIVADWPYRVYRNSLVRRACKKNK